LIERRPNLPYLYFALRRVAFESRDGSLDQERRIGDKRLLANIERRLKTLKNSTDFEKSFGRAKMAG